MTCPFNNPDHIDKNNDGVGYCDSCFANALLTVFLSSVWEGNEMNDGGPAFPSWGEYHDETGMSLRYWFAGQALIGLCSRPSTGDEDYTARRAYAYADAMLKAQKPLDK